MGGAGGNCSGGGAGSVVGRVKKPQYTVVPATVAVPPGLTQIVLEVLTNAWDHAKRPGTHVKNIWVTMEDATGLITVKNDGAGIPVRPHTQFPDLYLPSVLFSMYKSGSNFDDTVQREGAGRNGAGVKCTNTWSTLFTVETADGAQLFRQTWRNNLSVSEPPIRTASTKNFTRITFRPDYARFHVEAHLGAVLEYLRTLIWHFSAANNQNIHIHLDGLKLPVRNLRDYAKIMSPDGVVLYDEGTQLQVAVCVARPNFPTTVGFVNSIPCHHGTHVNFVWNRITEIVGTALGKDGCSAAVLKSHLMVLVNATVINPTFKGQTKEQLSLDMRKSGCTWEPSKAFTQHLKKHAVVDTIRFENELRATRKASGPALPSRQRRVVVDGYEPAGEAGNPRRTAPTYLFVVEGESAKSFAIAGLSVLGRDYYGVFPLRGKILNVRGELLSTVLRNAEMGNLLKVLGVNLAQAKPQTTKDLFYDHIIVLTDSDFDGSHIAGLFINAIDVLLADILRTVPNFIQRFATPLVKAWPKTTTSTLPPQEFFTEREFEQWWGTQPPGDQARYDVKYFKGLGTSTARDAKFCCMNLTRYVVNIDCTVAADRELLQDFFDAKRVLQRKALLEQADAGLYEIDYQQPSISLRLFLMGEVLPYFRYDNERSIADARDGLTTARRKILWVTLTAYGDVKTPSIKVAQLAGDVARRTQYKHAETSLATTIVSMAADFPLSNNNINLLVPEGQFGNRHGNEAASARYIFTCAEPITRDLFPKADFPVYTLLRAEGQVIEPEVMVPVMALLVCNGANGVGSGFSSDVMRFNPLDVMQYTRAYIHAQRHATVLPVFTALPWVEGFTGEIKLTGPAEWLLEGRVVEVTPTTIQIQDLPKLTNKFLFSSTKKGDVDFATRHPHYLVNHSTDVTVQLTLQFTDPVTADTLKRLQDRSNVMVKSSNMMLWDHGIFCPKRFTLQDILDHHAQARVDLYHKRRAYDMAALEQQIAQLTDEYRFVCAVMADSSFIFRRPKQEVEATLRAQQYRDCQGSYNYLLRLPVASFTTELLHKLEQDRQHAETALTVYASRTVWDLWEADLDQVAQAYTQFSATRVFRRANPEGPNRATPVASKKRRAPAAKASLKAAKQLKPAGS